MGDILFTSNSENPTNTYLGTTWELLPDNKFLKTGSTPLQQAGSNSIKIAKANLPAEKLQVESHSMTRGTMNITGSCTGDSASIISMSGCLVKGSGNGSDNNGRGQQNHWTFDASRSWTGSTSSASPYTVTMGSGTPITVNPEHITVKAWKRTK